MALYDDVAGIGWYHTIELPGGVVTPGQWDLRPIASRVPLPSRLDGLRCLDVGTHDGFWAFEMERRGAAEVLAIDLDDPTALDWPGGPPAVVEDTRAELARRHEAFHLAHAALGSRVERRDLSVYALDPDEIGTFDVAVIGTLLLHLRDRVGALRAIRRVARRLLVNEVVSVSLSLRHPRRGTGRFLARPGRLFWWVPNVAALRQEVVAAGWRIEAAGPPYLVPYGPAGPRVTSLRERVRDGAEVLEAVALQRGAPHAWVLAGAPDARS